MRTIHKRAVAILLALLLLCGAVPGTGIAGLSGALRLRALASTHAGSCGENVQWVLDMDSGVLDITGTGAMEDYSWGGDTPWYDYRGVIAQVRVGSGVTHIGSSAFDGCKYVTSVVFPAGLESIGGSAFYGCRNLLGANMPDSVTSLGADAFAGCVRLASVHIPTNLTFIDYDVFLECRSLHSVTIPSGVVTISGWAFSGSGLESVTIPDSVTTIGPSAFESCKSLTQVHLGKQTGVISGSAFGDCTSLTAFTVHAENRTFFCDADGVLFNRDGTILVHYPCGKTQLEYTVPDGVVKINADSFATSLLTQVIVHSGVATIGSDAFLGVGNVVYSGSASGSPWGARAVNAATDGYFTFADAEKTTLIACAKAAQGVVTVPESVAVIEEYAFENCDRITEVVLPSALTDIGEGAFTDCDRLQSVNIPGTVRVIGMGAFSYCYRLTEATLEEGIEEIGQQAFFLAGLASIAIPRSVESIGDGAFACRSSNDDLPPDSDNYRLPLLEITVDADNAFFTAQDGVLYNKEMTELIQYPCGKADTDFYIPQGVTTVWELAFYTAWNVSRLVFPSTVTEVGEGVYYMSEERPADNTIKLYVPQNAEWTAYLDVYDPVYYALLMSVDVRTAPDKTTYGAGETLDLTGIGLDGVYDDGATLPLPYTAIEADVTTLDTVGEQSVNVSYGGCTATFSVTVLPGADAPRVSASEAVVGCSAGRRVQVQVQMQNNPGVAGLQVRIGYDTAQLRLVQAENGEVFPAAAYVPGGDLAAAPYTLFWSDEGAQSDNTADGTLATLTFEVLPGAQAGDTAVTVTLADGAASNLAAQPVQMYSADGAIRLAACTPGDANGDGIVNLKDAVVIRRSLADGWDVQINALNADVNGDGTVDLRDAVLICRFLAGGWDASLI